MRRNIRIKLAALMAFTSILGNKTLGMGTTNNYFGSSTGKFSYGQKTDEWQNLSKESKYAVVGGVALLLLLGAGALYLINNKDTKSKVIKNDFCDINLEEKNIKDKEKKYKGISDKQLIANAKVIFEKTKEILISYKSNDLLGKLYHFFSVNNMNIEYREKDLGIPDKEQKQKDIQKQKEGKLVWINNPDGETIKKKFYIADNENCFLKDIAACLNNKEIIKNLVINAEVDYYFGTVRLKFSFKLNGVECEFGWSGANLLYIQFKNNKINKVSNDGLFVGFEYKNPPLGSVGKLFDLEKIKN